MTLHRATLAVAFVALVCAPLVAADTDRPATFEDIYGPSGDTFQGALGFRVLEGTSYAPAVASSLGATVDDMVVQWREFKLVGDGTDCATSGACASIGVDTGNAFEANGTLGITVTDSSPYGQTVPVNDCNHDSDFTDAGTDDPDCDDDGTPDVLVRATATADPAGEWVVLNRVDGSSTYRGTLPISTVVNALGVLFFTSGGINNPEVALTYDDRWDGSAAGTPCRASADPALWGRVSVGVEIAVAAGVVSLPRYRISDASGAGSPPLPPGQDGDGYPDTNETADLFVTVRNQTGQALTNLMMQLVTSDPKIDCVLVPTVAVGSLPVGATVEVPTPFRFKIAASADRSGAVPPVACTAGTCSNGAGACSVANDCKRTLLEEYAATFTVTLAADQFDTAAAPQTLVVDIDLDSVTAVKATSAFVEGFESGLTNFVQQNLDGGIASNALSNGKRCQYNDPEFGNSNSYGDSECYLGFQSGQPTLNDWHPHDTTTADGGRAYLGLRSLHYGIHTAGSPGLDTYALSQLDAIRHRNPVHLAARVCRDDTSADPRACNESADCAIVGGGLCVSASPELSFKQQISLTDNRSTSTPFGMAADRGVLHVQVSGATTWQKIVPYLNVYDVQGTDNFSNCLFDPDDDGNNEDSYFDLSDPDRRLGPSSTCYPEFVFAYLGDTDNSFATTNIGRASDGPGLPGSLGVGTWVESRFDLSRFRGRSIRVRWLITTIKVSDTKTLQDLFSWNPNPADDGWYVDDVRMSQTLGASIPSVSLDTADNGALPGCGSICSSLTAALTATPASTPAPGRRVILSALGTTADRCLGGVVLSQFWIDGDGNGVLGDPADTLLRDDTVDPNFNVAPLVTTRYGVRVRCSAAPTVCVDEATVLVPVGCPGSPNVYVAEAWWSSLRFEDRSTLVTPMAGQSIDAVRGGLNALRASGAFGGETCLANDASSRTVIDPSVPLAGNGFYYLLRGADAACNENRSYRTFSPKENPDLPARRDAQISACPP